MRHPHFSVVITAESEVFLQLRKAVSILFLFVVAVLPLAGQQVSPALYAGMRWRLIGPFRGGRSLAAVGVPGQANVFYFGAVGGGVWKTTDAGRTWNPIFDSEKIASIGALAVAPSNPNVIYVGTGEADMRSDITYGNGVYKSTDAGKTWTHLGLADTQQIGRILIDPKNPDVAYVAALGHAYGPNAERGVFKTTDGGKTWQKVLYKDENTGAIDLAFDPDDANVIYAALWQTRRPPWNVYPTSNGPGSGLYKSTDAGATWQKVEGGLPTEGLGRIGIAVAPSNRNVVYAIVDAKAGGVYRSDDTGKTWELVNKDNRVWGRGWYFGAITVDPKDANTIYVCNTQTYKSTDGGRTLVGFKGAPGGDDYHSTWVAPEDPSRIILSSDQGTIITLNGGKTWSSWYNQPTGQFYHVATDNQFPYWVYGAQQDSGAMAVASRSKYASITAQDWHAISVGGENGTIAPDPLDSNILFGGTVTRYIQTTGQNQNVSPSIGRPGPFRHTWTLPLAFSQADPHKLYFSYQYLFRTTNGGQSWDQISPDLTRENPAVPLNLDPITAKYGLDTPRKGVIYSIAPSPLDGNMVWAGTDDGLIHLTQDDGKNWRDVTPKELTPWCKVGIIEASHFDKQTAYAAVDRHRLDDYRPYIYRTRDGGATWQLASKGIPDGAFVNVVREDPERRGLLYAGTELGMYVSFDDGDSWQNLQLNLPVTSIRDIGVHGNDLVVATHGRAFWILDDVTPLRQAEEQLAADGAHLFKPGTSLRVRFGSDQATPFPADVPSGQNPPNGAIIDYYLNANSASPVVLEVLDSRGQLVRRYSSDEKPAPVNEKSLRFPTYWVKPAEVLLNHVGMHRFVWDLHYAGRAVPDQDDEGTGTSGPWAPPGEYTVRLTANGKTYSQPLAVKMDPRVKASIADLEAQFVAAKQAGTAIDNLAPAVQRASALEKRLAELQQAGKGNRIATAAMDEFSRKISAVVGPAPQNYGPATIHVSSDRTSLRFLMNTFETLESAIESADAAPTLEQQRALREYEATLQSTMAQWQQIASADLPKLNSQLKAVGMPELAVSSGE